MTVLLGMTGAQADPRDGSPVFQVFGAEIVGDDSDRLELGAGAFNIFTDNDPSEGSPDDDTHAALRLEYRLGRKAFGIGPKLGILANDEGGVYGYAAIYTDVRYDRLVISPSAGLGGYRQGDGKDLGGVFQFILSLDAAYEFESRHRLGVKFSHISNARIHDDNPGEESLMLTYSIPLDF